MDALLSIESNGRIDCIVEERSIVLGTSISSLPALNLLKRLGDFRRTSCMITTYSIEEAT